MKIVVLLLFVTINQAIAFNSYAQNKRLSLNLKNEKIINILDEIERKSDFYFMFDASKIDVIQKKDIDCENQTIAIILDQLFENTGITYHISNRQIGLIRTDYARADQRMTISGHITDASSSSLPGVSVVIKGTAQGTITNAEGYYTLTNIPSNATLVFSFVGMKTQEVLVAGKTSINITMQEDAIGIEEVVAVGYGTKSKATVTGSISNVDEEQLASRPASQTTDLLQGMVAGVQITRGNSGRIADTGNNISIRGLTSRSDPGVLIVIDGIAQKENNTYAIDNINPDDIKDISILKDAQASIYGARAAGGVILITTKKGTTEKPTIEFSANYNIQSPSLWTKLNDVIQVCEMNNEGFVNDGQNTNMYPHKNIE